MTKKKVQKGSASRKRRPTANTDRARAEELLSTKKYSETVNAKLQQALDSPEELRRLLAAIDEGESRFRGVMDKAFDAGAMDYAFKAYAAALEHYHAHHADPLALSRLAVVYDETRPGDFHMVVTLPGKGRDRAVSDKALRGWLRDVKMICRTLEHPDCPAAFAHTFGAVFTDNILGESSVTWTDPTVVRVMLPLALNSIVRNASGEPEQLLAILLTMRDALTPDALAEEVRASVVKT
jgi:hypothetical protein